MKPLQFIKQTFYRGLVDFLVAPVGGALMIAGWLCLAFAAFRS